MQSRSPIGSRTYHSYCRLMIDQISRYLEYPRGTIAFLSLSLSLFLSFSFSKAAERGDVVTIPRGAKIPRRRRPDLISYIFSQMSEQERRGRGGEKEEKRNRERERERERERKREKEREREREGKGSPGILDADRPAAISARAYYCTIAGIRSELNARPRFANLTDDSRRGEPPFS